ncbi:MAG TPA: hypothetical protein PKN17_06630, partial [Bacillota bacterium]|nr:hypothetical protein [Bacillota bacterium]
NNGGTMRYSIQGEKLIVNNLDVDKDGNPVSRADGTPYLQSADGVVLVYPSLKMEKIARSDYTIEYELTYLAAQSAARYCGIVYNFNGKTSYDIFMIRVRGAGNNQRRIAGGHYTTYDNAQTDLFAANMDTDPARTSIVSKLTKGETKVFNDNGAIGITTETDISKMTGDELAKHAPMLGKTLNVRIEVNQVKGPEIYINDILVSKAATYLTDPDDKDSEVAANTYWGAQTNYGEFAIGFFVSNRIKLAIDNIKVTGWVNEYTEADMLRAYDLEPNKEPATGDATIYVTIAMAVSFISLAALVVTKRRGSRVK